MESFRERNAFEENVQFSWKQIVIHFSDHLTSSSRWSELSYTVFAFFSLSTGTSERHNLTPGQNVFPLCVEEVFLIKTFPFFQRFIFHWNLSQPAYFTFSLLASEVGSARGFSSSFDPNNFSILAFDPRSMIQQLESFIFWCSLLFFIPRWFGSQLWVPSSYI